MTTAEHTQAATIPDEVARQIVLPEGHGDRAALQEAYKWGRNNAPLATPVVEVQAQIFSGGGGKEQGAHNPILQNQAGDGFMKSLLGGPLRLMDALPYLDPPEPTEIKFITNDWFRPTQLQKWTEQIGDLAKASVEKLEKLSATGEIDLPAHLAPGLPPPRK